jgi:hypothetical protein
MTKLFQEPDTLMNMIEGKALGSLAMMGPNAHFPVALKIAFTIMA